MAAVKVPKLIEDTIAEGSDGIKRRLFTFPTDTPDASFHSSLGPEWLDQPEANQKAEMARQYRNWVAALNPPPPTQEDMQARLGDLTRELLSKQAELTSHQQMMLDAGIVPDLAIVVASPPQPEEPLPEEPPSDLAPVE